MALRVLVIEDHGDLAANIVDYLEGHGMVGDAAGDGLTGLHLAVTQSYDVVVLDLGLPGMDGLAVCRALRERPGSPPVLVLSARDSLEQRLVGFEAGADDYLVKPFALEELLARIRAVARRGSGQHHDHEVLAVGDLSFDPQRLEVRRAGVAIQLPKTGLVLLECLMRSVGRVVTRETLERAVWGDDPPDSDALRAHIHTLRTAIDRPFSAPMLHTVHGIGYRLEEPDGLSS